MEGTEKSGRRVEENVLVTVVDRGKEECAKTGD